MRNEALERALHDDDVVGLFLGHLARQRSRGGVLRDACSVLEKVLALLGSSAIKRALWGDLFAHV